MHVLRRLLAASVLMVLLAGGVAAQSPEPSGVDVLPGTAELEVSVEEARTIKFEVEHTGGVRGVPGVGDRTFLVHVQEDLPDGWLVDVAPRTFDLAPGHIQDVTLTVQVTTGAQAEATIRLVAQLVPHGLQAVPGAGPVADPDAEAVADVHAARAETLTRTLLETLDVWVYVLLLGILALLAVVGVLMAQRSRGTIQLDAPSRDLVLGPGGRGTLRLLVQNTGRRDDTVVFHVSQPDPGWAAFLPVAELPLRADHAQELQLVVVAPKDAQPGTRQDIQVKAAGSQSPGRAASITLEAVVGPMPQTKAGATAAPS